MKNIFAFEQKEDFERFQGIVERLSDKLTAYEKILRENYDLCDLPKAIVWTTNEIATSVFSNVPIPAYTNKDIIYLSPELSVWRNIFLEQLEGHELPHIIEYYESFSEDQLLCILAHELTHHSDLFLDEFEEEREDSIWFEEGMCDYLSRKLVLDDKEFKKITSVEEELLELFKEKYGQHSLDKFGSASYQGTMTSIMVNYWRSFSAITFLVEKRYDNDIKAVFDEYHKWNKEGRKVPLTTFFDLEGY
ncbi:hypothetical protein WAK64_07425 [Bacillus spongiae]|uniref:Elongation factor Tu n=1 Tax=Bacillus spongiae TaxID=2683610 RepID=A0ABU8HC26_9BACI